MNSENDNADHWERCPAGTLVSLSKRSKRRRMLKQTAWMAPMALLVLLAFTLNGVIPNPFGLNSQVLLCDQVVKLLPAYASNSLADSKREQVEKHLAKCPACRAKLQSIQEKASVASYVSLLRREPMWRWERLLTGEITRRLMLT